MIRFEGVHKWFRKLHVLNNVNLHVKRGSGGGLRPVGFRQVHPDPHHQSA